jgi:hypothetical protein
VRGAWAVVADRRVPGLERFTEPVRVGDLFVYHRGGTDVPSTAPLEIDVRTLAVTASAGELPAEPGQRTVIRVAEDAVLASTSVFNEEAVYVAENAAGGFAYFTDLLLAALVLPELGLEVRVSDEPVGADPEATLVPGVRRLCHSTREHRTRVASGWRRATGQSDDLLELFREPHRDDPLTAGKAQLSELDAVIGAIAAERPGTGYATLLSGGIDSGTVTYLAAARGLDVLPYSVGTPWGDEFADAQELCDAAGLELRRVHLDEDAIVRAIPAAVRWLGTSTAEVVEVALTATAVYQAGVLEPGRVLLTGYGSDLINAGLFTPFESPEELIEQGLESIRRTRTSGELSNRMPLAHGVEAFHPFWTLPVMRVALETAPACKVRDGREKFHLRSAMAQHVPPGIAWRRKIAVHHGGGLQDGIRRRVAADLGGHDPERVYRACFAELLALAGRGRLDDWDAQEVYAAAVAASR